MKPTNVLLCPPTHFAVTYAINPWMDPTITVDQSAVTAEYNVLKAAYRRHGIEVLEIQQHPDLPDMVYTANHGVVAGQQFIPANFLNDERKAESKLAAEFMEQHGYQTAWLPQDIVFEGQGDLLETEKSYFMGHGIRTHRAAEESLAKLLPKPIVAIEMTDPRYFHLDTCLTPLSPDAALVIPDAVTPESLATIRDHFNAVIEISDADAARFACNMVVLGQTLLIGQSLSDQLISQLRDLGFELEPLATTEYLKAGGSVKCLSLVWEE